VVDVDLERFFDHVNHDILMAKLARFVSDPAVLRLVRAYLDSGIMRDGVVIRRYAGTPQGGPLSPLLANVLLDEVDRELERRGVRFERYADDCNIYVRSQRAGERVLVGLRQLYAKLKLYINEAKTSVRSAFGAKFLGYALRAAPEGAVKRVVAAKAIAAFQRRVRQLTRRNRGRSLQDVIEKLRAYLLGWKAYFRLAQWPSVWRRLDEWLRRRLRALQLKHWRRGRTIYRECRRLGASSLLAQQAAGGAGHWWRGSLALNPVLTIAHFDRLGLPRLC
jgi:RNA-directed DNA polymerase